jgi:hypothetical protein
MLNNELGNYLTNEDEITQVYEYIYKVYCNGFDQRVARQQLCTHGPTGNNRRSSVFCKSDRRANRPITWHVFTVSTCPFRGYVTRAVQSELELGIQKSKRSQPVKASHVIWRLLCVVVQWYQECDNYSSRIKISVAVKRLGQYLQRNNHCLDLLNSKD